MVELSIEGLIARAAKDIAESKHAIALTGAGISTESGIADFRGPDGVWTKDPEAERRAYEAYPKFQNDPKEFWIETLENPSSRFEMWRQAQPNPGHHALTELEQLGFLKQTITQNIDGLHEKAGTKNLLEYHGGIYKLRCLDCGKRFGSDKFDLEQMKARDQLPPRCISCGNPIKSDVVYFGEPIPTDVAMQSEQEARECDVMMICGTSAVVYPFASLPLVASRKPRSGLDAHFSADQGNKPAVVFEVNAEPTPLTKEGISDYFIQGKTGEILPELVENVKRLTV